MKKLLLCFIIFQLLFTPNMLGQSYEIYVSDAGNFSKPPWNIFKFDENGENPNIFIDDSLAWPQDILFLDDPRIVLISNLSSGIITKHDPVTGDYEGNFATGLEGPTRIKIGPDKLLYVLQWSGNGKVVRYNLDGTFVDEFTKTGVPQSIGLDWDRDDNLYVSSYKGDYVRKFDKNGYDLGLFISTQLEGPTNIWFDENGYLLVTDYDGASVKRFNSEGIFIGNFIQGIKNAEGVDIFPGGNILIGNGGNNSVKLFDRTGNFIKDIIPSGAGGLINPNAVVIRESSSVKN